MDTSKAGFGDLEIKKTPQGFLIEKGENSIEIRDSDANILQKALINLISERDFEFLANLLPKAFVSGKGFGEAIDDLKGKNIILISDLPEFKAELKAILEQEQIIQIRYLQLEDVDVFDEDVDLILAFHHQPHRDYFLKLNRFCLDNGVVFIKAMIDNFKFIVTPFALPNEAACYNCYLLLKQQNSIFDRDTLEPADFINTSGSKPPAFAVQLGAGFLVLALLRLLTFRQLSHEELAEIVLDFRKIEISRNPLLKVPFCNACGSGPAKK